MRATSSLLAIAVLSLALSLGGGPAGADTSLDYSPRYDEGPLAEARAAYRERRDYDRAREAYELLKGVAAQRPEDVDVAWHLALACYFMGIRVLDDSDEKKAVFLEGRDFALAAIDRNPECAECHLLAATNHALWGQEEGIFRTLVGLPKVKHHLKRSIELNPAFGGAAAQRVNAYIARALPSFLGGGKKRALKWIEEALASDPVEPMNYAFLAELLLEDYKDEREALEVARRGLSIPRPADYYVESIDALRDLRKIVARIEDDD